MTLREIRLMPTTSREIEPGARGAHESLLRSYHVLDKIEDWLRKGAPAAVILELMEDLRG